MPRGWQAFTFSIGGLHDHHPAKLEGVRANDVCLHVTRRAASDKPLEGVYYDWPVGYQPGDRLSDTWMLEEHRLGTESFTHWPDGSAHKNRMQGNDYVQSQMSVKGVRCYACHDVHGTPSEAELREPGDAICLQCHGPQRQPGPPGTIEHHTPTFRDHREVAAWPATCRSTRDGGQCERSKPHVQFISPSMTEPLWCAKPCTSCHADPIDPVGDQRIEEMARRLTMACVPSSRMLRNRGCAMVACGIVGPGLPTAFGRAG